jgi:hypothetical protein
MAAFISSDQEISPFLLFENNRFGLAIGSHDTDFYFLGIEKFFWLRSMAGHFLPLISYEN